MNSTLLEFNFYCRCNLNTALKVLNNPLMFKTQFPVTCQERINPLFLKKGFFLSWTCKIQKLGHSISVISEIEKARKQISFRVITILKGDCMMILSYKVL